MARGATLPLSELQPTTTTSHYTICCKNLSLTLLKMGKRSSETCWADLGDQYILIVASSWFFYTTLPTLMMHGQTQINTLFILMCTPIVYNIININNQNYFDTCTVHLLLFLIITNKSTINTVTVYITIVSLCNLYCYMFRHFHVIIREFLTNFNSYNLRTYISYTWNILIL